MQKFKTFLLAEAATSEEKLTHLEHNEDHVFNAGHAGFTHAVENLNAVRDKLQGKKNNVDVQVKHDGSPSIVFGHHPETGKFFVASKSAFNKDPKINYTHEDVEKNHGHSPGLTEKLKAALDHLPKIAPKKGVFQGDLMYSHGDVKSKGGKYHFTPNTITYSTGHNTPEGKKIAKAKLGVLIHTAYKGKTFADMKADYTPDKSVFKEHPDVHQLSNAHDFSKTKLTPQQAAQYEHHMKAAHDLHGQLSHHGYAPLELHQDALKKYINKTVRDDSTPSVEGYHQHVSGSYNKEIEKLKSEKGKTAKQTELQGHSNYIQQNTKQLHAGLQLHHHLQKAKDILVHALAGHQTYEHHLGDEKTKPEGYVIVKNNRPSKFVDRAEFSRANFAMSQNRKK